MSALELAEVIAGHDGWRFHSNESWSCRCGEPLAVPEGLVRPVHRAHLAAVVLAHLEADGWAKAPNEAPEIRYAELVDGATELDEVVARNAYVHLEAMSDSAWWLGIEAGGQMVHVNLWTKRAKITGRAEVDDL